MVERTDKEEYDMGEHFKHELAKKENLIRFWELCCLDSQKELVQAWSLFNIISNMVEMLSECPPQILLLCELLKECLDESVEKHVFKNREALDIEWQAFHA